MRWVIGQSENSSRINIDKIERISSETGQVWGGDGHTDCDFFAHVGGMKYLICRVQIVTGAPYYETEFIEKILAALNDAKDGETIDLQILFPKQIKIRPKKLRPKKMKPVVW
ncbi:MAG: hypothetical protein WC586_04055 [Methanoregula sp.]